MPDNTDIERTIFKLELDGSAYVEGANAMADSTKKLSVAQIEANKSLANLQSQEKAYAEQLETVNAVLKENEKETIALSKDLNLLKEAGKGATAEAKNLQSQIRNISTSTKEFRAESATLKTNLTATTAAIKTQQKEIAALEPATTKAAGGFTKLYSGLRTIANLIPGIGIGGLVALIAGPLVSAIGDWISSMDLVGNKLNIVDEAITGTDEASINLKNSLKELGDTADDIAENAFKNLEDATKGLSKELGKTPTAVEVAQGALLLLRNDLDKTTKKLEEVSAKGISPFGFAPGATEAAQEKQLSDQIDKTNALIIKGQKDLADNARLAKEKADSEDREIGRKIREDDINLEIDANNKILQDKKNSLAQRRQALTINLNDEFELHRIELDRELEAAKGNETKIALAQEKFRFDNLKSRQKFSDEFKKIVATEVKDIANIYEQELQKLKADIAKASEQGFTNEASIIKSVQEDFKNRAIAFDKAFKDKKLTDTQLASLNGFLKNLEDLTLKAQLESFHEAKTKYLQAITEEITNAQTVERDLTISLIKDDYERQRQEIIFQTDKNIAARVQQRDKEIAEIIKNGKSVGLELIDLTPQINQLKKTYSDIIDDLIKIRNQKLEQLSFDAIIALGDEATKHIEANRQKAKKSDKDKLDQIASYADAIGAITDSVIQFWQAANDAETKALDYSISLQEKRVEEAQRIADRGNAQYLKSELDRLNELNVARENAARKQLGIDAALQASQILVGITGAISKIATPGIGVAETISEIAVIIGALATGYGLVKSLQGNQPKFFKGTKYLERDGHPAGIDTIPARLNEGEAVIPTAKNKAYHETVAAIYDGTVPPEHLNQFVKQYHGIKSVPIPNFERIKEATELKIGSDGKTYLIMAEQNALLRENTDLQRMTLKAIKSMGINVSMDKEGFAMSFLEVAKQIQRDKKI